MHRRRVGTRHGVGFGEAIASVAHLAMPRRSGRRAALSGWTTGDAVGRHDNTLKEWIFDRDDGEARLLRFRAGHSKPPTNVSFYGQGKKLLASGHDRTLRFFQRFETSKT